MARLVYVQENDYMRDVPLARRVWQPRLSAKLQCDILYCRGFDKVENDASSEPARMNVDASTSEDKDICGEDDVERIVRFPHGWGRRVRIGFIRRI